MKKTEYLLLAVIVLIILLPVMPYFRFVPSEDSGMYLYHAKRILEGMLPYKDTWEHKGPVILYINTLGLFLGQGSRWGIWLLEYLFLFTAALINFKFLSKFFGKTAAFFSISLIIFSLVFLIDGGNLPEEYNILFQMLALILFFNFGKNKSSYYLIGLLASLSFLLKHNLIGIYLTIAIYILVSGLKNRDARSIFEKYIFIFLGFSLALSFVTYYFYLNGGLAEFFDGFVTFNFVYQFSSILSKIKSAFMGIWILSRTGLSFISISAWIIGVMYFVKRRGEIKKYSSVLFFGLISLPVEIVLSSLTGIHPAHYYMPWLYSLSILAGFFAAVLTKNLKTKIGFLILTSMLIAMSMPSLGTTLYQLYPDKNDFICKDIGWFLLPGSSFFECGNTKEVVIKYVLENTKESDYILVWGFGGTINFLGNRNSPSRFTYQYPLFLRGYQNDAKAQEIYINVLKNEPKLIIDATNSTYRVPPLDQKKRMGWEYGEIPSEMERLFELIDNNYQLIGEFGDDKWKVLKLK